MDAFVRQFNDDHASSVVVLMSHGEEGKIQDVNGELVILKDIFDKFKTCGALVDKPKMFFIQACRGSKYGVTIGNLFVVYFRFTFKQKQTNTSRHMAS